MTGIQYTNTEKHHFRTIGCLFNNQALYANIQVTDSAERLKINFSDNSHWKKLENDGSSAAPSFALKPPSFVDTYTTEMEVELVLKQLIEFYRKDHYLSCLWDESMSQLLGQSLWSMEFGKLSGQSTVLFSDDFQMGVKRSIPDGHTFKGFPMFFNHTHPQRMMQAMIKSKKFKEILLSRGDITRMAVCVKVFVYCENVTCCWVMIASRCL